MSAKYKKKALNRTRFRGPGAAELAQSCIAINPFPLHHGINYRLLKYKLIFSISIYPSNELLCVLQLNPEDRCTCLSVSLSLKNNEVLRARHAVFCFVGSKRLRLSPPTIRQVLISFDIGIFTMISYNFTFHSQYESKLRECLFFVPNTRSH